MYRLPDCFVVALHLATGTTDTVSATPMSTHHCERQNNTNKHDRGNGMVDHGTKRLITIEGPKRRRVVKLCACVRACVPEGSGLCVL